MAPGKKKKRKLSPDKERERWEARLKLRASVIAQVASCIAGEGDCSSICKCIGDSCACISAGAIPSRVLQS